MKSKPLTRSSLLVPQAKGYSRLLLATGLMTLTQAVYAADHTWSYDFQTATAASAAETLSVSNGWGALFNNNATRYNSVSGAPVTPHNVHFNTYGADHGVTVTSTEEQVGAMISLLNAPYNATSMWNNGTYDISNHGDSFTLKTFWQAGHFQDGRSQVPAAGGTNQVFQIGIGDSTSTQHGASGDYVYLAGLENAWTRDPDIFTVTGQSHELEYQLIAGSGSAIASNTTVTSSDLTHVRVGAVRADRYWYEYEITFTNDSGALDIDIDVDQWKGGVRTAGLSPIYYPMQEVNTSFHSSSLENVDHSLDLSQITPGLGIFVEDATTIATSAANYDHFTTVVPEPSTGMLSGAALLFIAMRRKRNH